MTENKTMEQKLDDIQKKLGVAMTGWNDVVLTNQEAIILFAHMRMIKRLFNIAPEADEQTH